MSKASLRRHARLPGRLGRRAGLARRPRTGRKKARQEGRKIEAMITNDIVGNTPGRQRDQGQPPGSASPPRGCRPTRSRPGLRRPRRLGRRRERWTPRASSARYIKEAGELYLNDFEVTLAFRRDRYGRGGDHIPFNERGYAAVRFTEPNENFDRQHKKVETVNGVEFGDVVDRVDFAYVAQVARVNAAALASLAAGVAASDHRPLRHWPAGIRHPDRLATRGVSSDLAGYRVVWRPMHQPFWTRAPSTPSVTSPPTPSRRSLKGSPRTTCSSPFKRSTATATQACQPSPSRPRSERPRRIASDAGGLRDGPKRHASPHQPFPDGVIEPAFVNRLQRNGSDDRATH